MVNSIDEVIKKMENAEIKRYRAGKEMTGTYGLLQDAVRQMSSQSSNWSLVSEKKEFAKGFINGLLAGYFITPEEFKLLENELYKNF